VEARSSLLSLFKRQEVPLFGVASCSGFMHAEAHLHPRALLPMAESAVIFGMPFVGPGLIVDQNTNLSNAEHWERNQPVFKSICVLRAQIVDLLDGSGYIACNLGGFDPTLRSTFSYRLAQHEAGVGVYGRFGVCINPSLGCYYTVGVLLTDAVLAPTDSTVLASFRPCRDCRLCADICPANAIDPIKDPETGYDRDRCVRFILGLKRRYGADAKACGRCFSICPWGYGKAYPERKNKTAPK
jgi:epoxyqueuosine reductase QueG